MPLVLAPRRRRKKLGRRLKLAGVLLATALTLTDCAPKWSSDRIPTYEPLPVDVSGFPNAADKAKLAEIAGYMHERLVAHHVDAPHANAILWQFHFFAPVRYFDDDCSSYVDLSRKETFKNEDEQIARMSEAAKDVFDRYDKAIPYSKLAGGAANNEDFDISGKNPSIEPIVLEYYKYVVSIPYYWQPSSFRGLDLVYQKENIIINKEISHGNFSRIPKTLLNYHLRNFIINMRVIPLNILSKNKEIPQESKKQAEKFGSAFMETVEYNYQDGAKKTICRS